MVRALASEGDVEGAVAALQLRYPDVPLNILRSDFGQVLEDVLKNHILTPVRKYNRREGQALPQQPKPLRSMGDELKTAQDKTTSIEPRTRERIAAIGAFILEIMLERVAPRAKLPLLKRLQAHAKREATYYEAQRMLYAVQTIPHLGRIACREAHWSASVAAGLFGLKVGWHKLGKINPLEYHESISVQGQNVITPRSGRVVGEFQDFFDVT